MGGLRPSMQVEKPAPQLRRKGNLPPHVAALPQRTGANESAVTAEALQLGDGVGSVLRDKSAAE